IGPLNFTLVQVATPPCAAWVPPPLMVTLVCAFSVSVTGIPLLVRLPTESTMPTFGAGEIDLRGTTSVGCTRNTRWLGGPAGVGNFPLVALDRPFAVAVSE